MILENLTKKRVLSFVSELESQMKSLLENSDPYTLCLWISSTYALILANNKSINQFKKKILIYYCVYRNIYTYIYIHRKEMKDSWRLLATIWRFFFTFYMNFFLHQMCFQFRLIPFSHFPGKTTNYFIIGEFPAVFLSEINQVFFTVHL